MPIRRGFLHRLQRRSPIDHCESALQRFTHLNTHLNTPSKVHKPLAGLDGNDEHDCCVPAPFLPEYEPEPFSAPLPPSPAPTPTLPSPRVPSFRLSSPRLEHESSDSSNMVSEHTVSTGFCLDGMDLGYLLADHSFRASSSVQSADELTLRDSESISDDESVQFNQDAAAYALDGAGSSKPAPEVNVVVEPGECAAFLEESIIAQQNRNNPNTEVIIEPPMDQLTNTPFLSRIAERRAEYEERRRRKRKTITVVLCVLVPFLLIGAAVGIWVGRVYAHTGSDPFHRSRDVQMSGRQLNSPHLPITVNSSPESIAAADEKDKHSKTKICCYVLVAFIPMGILLIIAAVIFYVLVREYEYSFHDKCPYVTRNNNTVYTTLGCKKYLDRLCFKDHAEKAGWSYCEKAGYHPNGTVTHNWNLDGQA